MRLRYLALLITVVCGCSTSPPRVPPSPAVAATPAAHPVSGQAAPTASPVLTAPGQSQPQASSPTATAATNTPASLAIDPDLVKRGYHPAIRRGQRVYCRQEPVTGSRFTQTRCMTADQISDSAMSTKDYLSAPRPDGTCALMKCN